MRRYKKDGKVTTNWKRHLKKIGKWPLRRKADIILSSKVDVLISGGIENNEV